MKLLARVACFAVVLACCAQTAGAAQFEDINANVGVPGGHGVAWGDYDGDGYADLFVTGRPDWPHPMILHHNDGDLTFTDVTADLGIPLTSHANAAVVWGDYNDDGNPDVFIGGDDGQQDVLLRFDGSLFTNTATSAGLTRGEAARTASWNDYDGDNLLDLFVCYVGLSSTAHLYHNRGDGAFTDVTQAAGISWPPVIDVGDGCAWGDYDNDGKPDLLVSAINDSHQALYHNDGDGRFTDVGATVFSGIEHVRGVAWADYDNDGWLDAYLGSNIDHIGWLMRNNRNGTFSDVTPSAGMADRTAPSTGVAWADYDNDGYLDLYVGGYYSHPSLYHNNGNGTFTDVAAANGLVGAYLNNSAAWADIDLDGKLDLVEVNDLGTESIASTRLLHNVGPAGSWLRIRTLTSATGDATDGAPSRDAIGARVEVNLDDDAAFPASGGRTLTRLIDGGSGCMGQNEQIAHFGLGASPLVAVRVTFPDGSVVVHRDVQANQQVVIRDVPAGREEIFDDVPLDHWAYPAIAAALDANIVQGYWDNTYRPTLPVDRASMAVYLARALAGGDAAVPDPTVPAPSFTDVGSDHWAYRYIEYVASTEANVVQGYPGGNYKPDQGVTRGQMAVYIARAMVSPSGDAALPDPPADPTFSDVTAGNDWSWCYSHVEFLAAEEVVQGYAGNLYHPEYAVTRDQMAVYIARAFQLPM